MKLKSSPLSCTIYVGKRCAMCLCWGLLSFSCLIIRNTVNGDPRWCCTYLLDPSDPLFVEIGTAFIKRQVEGVCFMCIIYFLKVLKPFLLDYEPRIVSFLVYSFITYLVMQDHERNIFKSLLKLATVQKNIYIWSSQNLLLACSVTNLNLLEYNALWPRRVEVEQKI